MKMKYLIRELQAQDINFIINHAEDVKYTLNFMLAAPERYKSEETNYEWYAPYTGNYGNSVRTVIESEDGQVISLITISNIDFNRGTGVLRFHAMGEIEKTVLSNCIKVLLGNVGIYLGLKELYWATDFQTVPQPILTKNYMELYETDEVKVCISDYCIDSVYFKEEKQSILSMFDGEMFHPLSINGDYTNVCLKIVKAADMLVAYNNKLLGFVAFYANDISLNTAYITCIAVMKHKRGKGIGHRLLEKSMEIAKKRGMETIALEVDSKNERAIDFYKKEGFAATGYKSADRLYMCRKL